MYIIAVIHLCVLKNVGKRLRRLSAMTLMTRVNMCACATGLDTLLDRRCTRSVMRSVCSSSVSRSRTALPRLSVLSPLPSLNRASSSALVLLLITSEKELYILLATANFAHYSSFGEVLLWGKGWGSCGWVEKSAFYLHLTLTCQTFMKQPKCIMCTCRMYSKETLFTTQYMFNAEFVHTSTYMYSKFICV